MAGLARVYLGLISPNGTSTLNNLALRKPSINIGLVDQAEPIRPREKGLNT